MMITYKCPACGCDITVTDTTLSTFDHMDFVRNVTQLSIETTMQHIGPMHDGCADILQLLVTEQTQMLKQVMQRTTNTFKQTVSDGISRNLHSS